MNIADMMKQAQEMQSKMQDMQEKLAEQDVEGESGGGMVSVTMSCKGVVKNLNIDPSVIDPSDKEMLEDLVKAALNDAKAKSEAKMAEETQKMMGGMGLPADIMSKMPF